MTRKSFSEDELKKARREWAAEKKSADELRSLVDRQDRQIETLTKRCNELSAERARFEVEAMRLRTELIDPIVELERVRREGPASKETELWSKLFVKLVEITGRK